MNRNFFLGNVKLVGQGLFRAKYMVENTNCIIKVKNNTHVRCTELNQSMSTGHLLRERYFEIIAPMDAVKVVSGSLPNELIKELNDSEYLSRRHYWDGS